MKTLNNYINESINAVARSSHEIVTVNTTDELKQLIHRTILKEGPNCDLNFIDVSKIKDMTQVFCQSEFNGDISRWDVSNVRVMDGMFLDSDFNGDISKWDVSNVKDMNNMFGYSKFSGDISKWDVSRVKDMNGMFDNSKLEKMSKLPIWYKQSSR